VLQVLQKTRLRENNQQSGNLRCCVFQVCSPQGQKSRRRIRKVSIREAGVGEGCEINPLTSKYCQVERLRVMDLSGDSKSGGDQPERFRFIGNWGVKLWSLKEIRRGSLKKKGVPSLQDRGAALGMAGMRISNCGEGGRCWENFLPQRAGSSVLLQDDRESEQL